jgi:hypothetical protein
MKYIAMLLCVLMLCGCRLKSTLDKGPSKQAAKEEAAPPRPEPPPKAEPVANDGKGIIGKMTDEIVDYEKAMKENPKLEEVEPRMKQGDLLSMYVSAYIDVGAQVGVMNMKHALDLYHAEHEKNPSYDEFMKMVRENQIRFRKLRYYQMYAYDAKRGKMTVLEDPDKRNSE